MVLTNVVTAACWSSVSGEPSKLEITGMLVARLSVAMSIVVETEDDAVSAHEEEERRPPGFRDGLSTAADPWSQESARVLVLCPFMHAELLCLRRTVNGPATPFVSSRYRRAAHTVKGALRSSLAREGGWLAALPCSSSTVASFP
jgi:hypothetical protein